MRVAISAGASGIGKAIASSFARQGAQVYVCDVDPAAVAWSNENLPGVVAVEADVADPASVDDFFDRIAADGNTLDILVNNAGIAGPTGPIETLDVDDWRKTIDIDLNSFFYCARRAIPMLRANGGGSVVNMASNVAFHGFPLRSPYTASKWAIIGLTKTMAMELGPDGIRVNALCPGSVEGPRIDRVIEKDAACRGRTVEQVEAEYKSQSSLRTFARNEDIVAMVQFLCSPAGERISGQAIGIDGHTEGLSLRMDN